MIIVNQRLVDEFSFKNASTRRSLATWRKITEEAIWKKKLDVIKSFPNAKMLANNRARFEIIHNKFRLIGQIYYDQKIVEIRFIGTHNEYDKIDPSTV
ncbi:MAG: hypothetical protein FD136_903 [Chitinophagaceae bacterium]|nr:MAG: hypothetical protein FD136_903 [Chitinophagaceae bacterium]